MKTCFFIGYHNAPPSSIQKKLNESVENLIQNCGVTEFIVDHHGNFDAMATTAVEEEKKHHCYAAAVVSPG